MSTNVGIVGSGLVGRLLALECMQRGWKVTLFDQDTCTGEKSCGWVAAGMIAPFTELESSELLLTKLGLESTEMWPLILKRLVEPVSFHVSGTLIISHPQDVRELARFRSVLQYKLTLFDNNSHPNVLTSLSRDKMETFAPGISPHILDGFWIPNEGSIDGTEFFYSTTAFLRSKQIRWFENTKVTSLKPYEIEVQNEKYHFDLVCDTRGLGGKLNWHGLRGVRGELVWLHTPEVQLHCPVRLLHPRYPIYVSPRANNRFVVGATSIESEDVSPISVESTLELLSAAYTIHPGFAEARLIKTLTQARPSFHDQQPKVSYMDGLLKINGLYRHGYMAGPAVIQDAMRLLENGKKSMIFPELLNEET